MKNRTLCTLTLGATLAAAPAFANELPVPRGDETTASASSCAIGPFEQTGKAGPYNRYCTELTDAEKCLALVKKYLNQDGSMERAPYELDQQRVTFCLEEFRQKLLGN